MNKIPASLSVAGTAYQHVTDWLNDYDSQAERVIKQISAEVAYTGIMIFGALETIARGVHALALKGFCHFFVEESKKKAFTKKYINPAGEGFLFSAAVMGGAAISLKDNLANCCYNKEVKPGKVIDGDKTINKVTEFYFKTFRTQLKAMGFQVP
jgi:hypothetical protein